MKRSIAATAAVLMLLCIISEAEETSDPRAPMRFFEGKWTGTGEGKSGISTTDREYKFILGGNFMNVFKRTK